MRARAVIAVATVSGKAYYKIVSELKSKNIPFLSMVPGEPIPQSVKVVITTESEKHLISHPNVLTYNVDGEASHIVDMALRLSMSKGVYEELIIGIDPGKTFGIAVLADGKTLKKEETTRMERAVDLVLTEITKSPSKIKRVRIGMGVPEIAEELARRLESSLPRDVIIEMVGEEGTSVAKSIELRRKLKDADSAVRIALKEGERRARGVSE